MTRTPRHDPYRLTEEIFGGRYRLDEFVGAGSFGAVYRATDTRIERPVAVKILKPDIEEMMAAGARELFQREALTAGRLVHPHIVAVTDTGEEVGFAYLVMEWLEGRTLDDELRTRSRLPPEETAALLAPIADALQLAHEAGVIHRDIKPANIHLGRPGRTHVKVLDFGIAKVVTSSSVAEASRIAGTLAYMAPEQLSGGAIDRRTDIYALGIMLYQVLTGTLPFTGDAKGQVIQQHMVAPPPLLSNVRPDLAPALSPVVQRALAKSPEERQQSAQELCAEFLTALHSQTPPADAREVSPQAETVRLNMPSPPPSQFAPPTADSRLSETTAQYQPAVKTPDAEINKSDKATVHLSHPASPAETLVQPETNGELRQVGKFALIGVVTLFLLSVGIGILARWIGLTSTPYSYDEFALSLITIALRDAVFGAFLGAGLSELRRPTRRGAAAKDQWGRAMIVHGALGASMIMMPFVLLRTSHFVLPLELAVVGFVAGLIVCLARIAVWK